MIVGVSGKLPAVREKIVAAGKLRFDPFVRQRFADHFRLAAFIVNIIPGKKGETLISRVMVDRAPSGRTPHQDHAVFFHGRKIAFTPYVLVASDDDRVIVLPEIKDEFSFFQFLEKSALCRKITSGISPRRFIDCKFFNLRNHI